MYPLVLATGIDDLDPSGWCPLRSLSPLTPVGLPHGWSHAAGPHDPGTSPVRPALQWQHTDTHGWDRRTTG